MATWKAINNLVLLYFHYLFIHRILPHCQPQDAWHTLKTLLLSPLSNQAAVCNNQLLLSSINCFNNAKTLCTLWTACLGMRVDTNLNVFRKPVFALAVWVTIHKKDCSCTMFALYCVTIQKNLCACPAHSSSSRLGLNCKRKHLHYKQHLLLLQCSLEVLHRCPEILAGCGRVSCAFAHRMCTVQSMF